MEKYNGWTNYETWCVNLWMTNDEYNEAETRRIAREAEDDFEAADALREYVEELNPIKDASLFNDIITSALGEVNWEELAGNYREDN